MLPSKNLYINDLSDVLLVEILQYVDWKTLLVSARHVCRRWYDVCGDRSVWKNKQVKIASKKLTKKKVKDLLKHAAISDLCIYENAILEEQYNLLDAETVNMLCKCWPGLERLSLQSSMQRITPTVIKKLARLPKLTCLELFSLFAVNNTTIAACAKFLPNLTKLVLRFQIENVNHQGLMNIAKLSKLTHLQISPSASGDSETVVCNTEVLTSISENCPLLESFHIRLTHTVDTEAIGLFCSNLEHLKSLHIASWCSDNTLLETLVANCHGLERFSFASIGNMGSAANLISFEGVKGFLRDMPTLKVLKTDFISIGSIEKLQEEFPLVHFIHAHKDYFKKHEIVCKI